MSERGLQIRGLRSAVAGTEILKGIDLDLAPGSVHALMGPNGSGKSTLAFSLTGHPNYEILAGSATLNGEELLSMPVDKRARAGLFLSFQNPAAIPGVSVANFLRSAKAAQSAEPLNASAFRKLVFDRLERLDMDPAFLGRSVNDGFSGGERKRLEMLQMTILKPAYAILDETDSGLDVDALRAIGDAIGAMRADEDGKDTSFLIITHYPRILEHIAPDVVHVMMDGRIVLTGGPEIAQRIEREGYDSIREQVASGV